MTSNGLRQHLISVSTECFVSKLTPKTNGKFCMGFKNITGIARLECICKCFVKLHLSYMAIYIFFLHSIPHSLDLQVKHNWKCDSEDLYERKACSAVVPSRLFHRAPVAQLVEHRAVTREVVSSTPARPTLRVFK